MRLVHLSDLHLGFRQYQRQTASGINQREADVAAVFRTVVDRVITCNPDLLVIAGDVFHSVRPGNPAILEAFSQFARLREALPNTIVVMVAGNHDTPRAAETGCILRLFSRLGIHVVDEEPRRLSFAERGLSVLAVPNVAGVKLSYDPDPAFEHNVLVMHGDLPGAVPAQMGYVEQSPLEVEPEALHLPKWSYVALGHYHVLQVVAPNAFYAGSIEYTSVNIWGEKRQEKAGKQFIEYDLGTKKVRYHKIESARELVDLPRIVARGMAASDVDEAIRKNVESWRGGIDGKIVRQVVKELPRHIARELDHRALREYRRRALHFHLDGRRPDVVRSSVVGRIGVRRPSLVETVREKLWSRPLSNDIDREALVELGLHFLREAEALETASVTVPSEESE